MSDHQKLKETLSALFDNEAGKEDQLELRRLARALDSDPELIETYRRYVLTRAVLRGESSSPDHFVTSVRAALEQERMENPSLATVAAKKPDLNWFKIAGRAAIAASVAVVAVYLVQLQLPKADLALPPAPIVAANTQTDPNNRVLSPSVMTVSTGGGQLLPQVHETRGTLPVGCVVSILRADSSDLVWEKELPAGYVLCKQNEQTKQCEAVASKIGCYLN